MTSGLCSRTSSCLRRLQFAAACAVVPVEMLLLSECLLQRQSSLHLHLTIKVVCAKKVNSFDWDF